MSDYTRITDRKIELTDEGVEELMADYAPTSEEVRELERKCSREGAREQFGISEQLPYTPTTGHVRARYVRDDANFLTDWAEFDRWLAEVKAEAWEEGCRWGAVEFQSLNGKLYDENKVQVTDEDNPYRKVK